MDMIDNNYAAQDAEDRANEETIFTVAWDVRDGIIIRQADGTEVRGFSTDGDWPNEKVLHMIADQFRSLADAA